MMSKKKLAKIEKDYNAGYTYKELAEKYKLTYNQVTYLVKKQKWKRQSNLSKTHIGNQNAKGNKGGPGATEGNKRALTTGEHENIFSTVFSEEENKVFNEYNVECKKQALQEELKVLTIREYRMLNRIKAIQDKNKDMTINSISKTNCQSTKWNEENSTTTITHAENTILSIQKIEDALTRVQEAKRRCIDSLNKIENDNRKLELDIIRLEMEAAKENELPDKENIQDDSFIKALQDTTEQIWENYEEEVNVDEQNNGEI